MNKYLRIALIAAVAIALVITAAVIVPKTGLLTPRVTIASPMSNTAASPSVWDGDTSKFKEGTIIRLEGFAELTTMNYDSVSKGTYFFYSLSPPEGLGKAKYYIATRTLPDLSSGKYFRVTARVSDIMGSEASGYKRDSSASLIEISRKQIPR